MKKIELTLPSHTSFQVACLCLGLLWNEETTNEERDAYLDNIAVLLSAMDRQHRKDFRELSKKFEGRANEIKELIGDQYVVFLERVENLVNSLD